MERHPNASVFHSPEWLRSLNCTYGFQSVGLTTTSPREPLQNGLVFCRVRSLLTGCRLISLPFADHCHPLVDTHSDLRLLLDALVKSARGEDWEYIEFRPLSDNGKDSPEKVGLVQSHSYSFHVLDLRPPADTLFGNFHESCVQRKIRRAQRERLFYEEGRSESILHKFYHLLVQTRRRQGLLPQPLDWFRNLSLCLGDKMKVRVASKDGLPIASILTLNYKNCVTYKYGCSDSRFHNLGGIPFLFWVTIQDAKNSGASTLDLGRSDADNTGLIRFKSRLGARSSRISYYRYPLKASAGQGNGRGLLPGSIPWAKLPVRLLTAAGKLLYKHMA